MSSGGGGSGNDGSNDTQVSGMEAAISKEKGISTHADTRVQSHSFHDSGPGNLIIQVLVLDSIMQMNLICLVHLKQVNTQV